MIYSDYLLACTITSGSSSGLTKNHLELGTTNNGDIIGNPIVNCDNPDGYDLSVKSANAAKFKNDPLPNIKIGYQLKINGNTINIPNEDEFVLITSFPPETVHVDEEFITEVTITGIGAGQAVQGSYSDQVTFRISAPV
jgi:hypothetical protein